MQTAFNICGFPTNPFKLNTECSNLCLNTGRLCWFLLTLIPRLSKHFWQTSFMWDIYFTLLLFGTIITFFCLIRQRALNIAANEAIRWKKRTIWNYILTCLTSFQRNCCQKPFALLLWDELIPLFIEIIGFLLFCVFYLFCKQKNNLADITVEVTFQAFANFNNFWGQ